MARAESQAVPVRLDSRRWLYRSGTRMCSKIFGFTREAGELSQGNKNVVSTHCKRFKNWGEIEKKPISIKHNRTGIINHGGVGGLNHMSQAIKKVSFKFLWPDRWI